MSEDKTDNLAILAEVANNHPKIANGGKVKRVAQNIAASMVYQDRFYKAGRRATIIDIGGGTTDLVAINVNPSQPFYLNPDYWINLRTADDHNTSSVNIGGNFRDEMCQNMIEEKVKFRVGLSFVRTLMAKYAFVDAEGYPELKSVPITGEFGEKETVDVFNEVRAASMIILSKIPLAIKTLAGRFDDASIRKEISENIFVTGHIALTKGLRDVLEPLIQKSNNNPDVRVVIFDDPLYAAARGALRLTHLLRTTGHW
jgi:actin-like ATPase involved in cell morphogenesis